MVLCRLGGKRGRGANGGGGQTGEGASGGGGQTGVERGGRYDKIIWFIKFINFLSLTFRASGLNQSERRRANARNVSLGTFMTVAVLHITSVDKPNYDSNLSPLNSKQFFLSPHPYKKLSIMKFPWTDSDVKMKKRSTLCRFLRFW